MVLSEVCLNRTQDFKLMVMPAEFCNVFNFLIF